LYLLRGSKLRQLNVVHEIHLAKDEEEDVEEATGYLGARLREDVDLRLVVGSDKGRRAVRNQGFQLRANDRLLLCSDGLSDALSDEAILEALGTGRIEDAANSLVQLAISTGSKDNMTAIVIGVPPARPIPARRRLALQRILFFGVASLLLIGLSLAGWYFWSPQIDPSYLPEATAIHTLTPIP
jgi:serine/threonine protein phosphatase PrpC